MRALTATEVRQVAGAQNSWVFRGEPVSVLDVQAVRDEFRSSVFDGTVAGTLGGAIRGPAGAAAGAIVGAVAGGVSWAYAVSLSPPMVTYTPVITIEEIRPGGNGCD